MSSVSQKLSINLIAEHLVDFAFAFAGSELRNHVLFVFDAPLLLGRACLHLGYHFSLYLHHQGFFYLYFACPWVVFSYKIIRRCLFELLLLHLELNSTIIFILQPLSLSGEVTLLNTLNLVELDETDSFGLGYFLFLRSCVLICRC